MGQFFKIWPNLSQNWLKFKKILEKIGNFVQNLAQNWANWYMNGLLFLEKLVFVPGAPLVSEVGYHPLKKIHVIRVVFQDKAMYARTSFRGAKTCTIGKKGMFLVILTNFGMDMTLKLRKTLAKMRI